jgi:serine/threonine protein kinase
VTFCFERVQRCAAHFSKHVQRPLAIKWEQYESIAVAERTDTSLNSRVREHHPHGLPPSMVARIAAQCVQALDAVHNCAQALHLNIHPNSVRLVDDSVRLVGFGACRPRTAATALSSLYSREYAAPESIGMSYVAPECMGTAASDVYSLGLTLGFALVGISFRAAPVHTGAAPSGLVELVNAMAHEDPDMRPTLDQVAEAPCIREHVCQ